MDVIPVMRPWLGDEEILAAAAAIESGWVAQGPRVAEFEALFARKVGAGRAVAVSSCTAGLHLVLHALGIGPGDEVITPSLSFIASANAPRYVGAIPVFADVDAVTQNVTLDTIVPVLTERTRAIIVVHQLGMPVDLDPIVALCDRRRIHLVEDAACAIGSVYKGAPIGSHTDHVVFSLHARKVVTTGEGGMIVTGDAGFADRIVGLRQHAVAQAAYERHTAEGVPAEEYTELGFNFRMTDIQAAVGVVQLGKLAAMVTRRRELAEMYRERLGDVSDLLLPNDPPYGETNYQSYSVVFGEDFPMSATRVFEALVSRGISPRRGVIAAHRQPAFAGHGHGPLPVTEFLTDNSLILPMYHEMSVAEVDRVATVITEAAHGG